MKSVQGLKVTDAIQSDEKYLERDEVKYIYSLYSINTHSLFNKNIQLHAKSKMHLYKLVLKNFFLHYVCLFAIYIFNIKYLFSNNFSSALGNLKLIPKRFSHTLHCAAFYVFL